MTIFLQWVLPILVLISSVVATYLLPPSQQTQVVAPLLVGIIMFILKSFLVIPNIELCIKDRTVTYYVVQDFPTSKWVHFESESEIINSSATGTGEISSLTLRIVVSEKIISIPVYTTDPNIIGFRFNPHSVFPSKRIKFETTLPTEIIDSLWNSDAKIVMKAVGQGLKQYKIILKK